MRRLLRFGKYLLLERINVGGMAEVYKAKLRGVEGFERLVAIKRILPSIAEDKEFISMFIDEARIASQLNHPNIVQIYELGKEGESYFIAMEYIQGKDVRAIFDRARKRGETVPIPMACHIMMKVCEGLDYAHNKKDERGVDMNLVHRDVSPQNIIVSYDGDVKIIDFGIAKAANKASQTQAGILKGKFGYMSPEQVRGHPIDRRSDIFSVGIVLYELLTGERLFQGESDFSTLEKVKNVDIMPPSTYNRKIPPALEAIVLKALAKNVADRYQSAMDLHDDLQSFMYTSGHLFSRKDLAAYMRQAFADDLAKELARQEEYRKLEQNLAEGSSTQVVDLHEIETEPSQPRVSLQDVREGAPLLEKRKATLLGVGNSIPSFGFSSQPMVAPTAPGNAGAALGIDWDDEELSTQVYDKPDLSKKLPDIVLPQPMLNAPAEALQGPIPEGEVARPALGFGGVQVPATGVQAAPLFPPSPLSPASSPTAGDGSSLPLPSAGPAPMPTIPPLSSPSSPSQALPRTSRIGWVVWGGVAILALAAVGGAWIFFQHRPGTIQLTTNPPDVRIFLNEQPVLASSSSPFVLAHLSPGTYQLRIEKEGYEAWTSTIHLEAGQLLTMPPVLLRPLEPTGSHSARGGYSPPLPVPTGFVLDTEPSGARVYVGDRLLSGRTPLEVTDLAPGTYSLRVEHSENYAPWVTQISIAPGQVLRLERVRLTVRNASVQFTSAPEGAEVTLIRGSERRRLGVTPITALVDVTGGPWNVVYSKPGYESTQALLSIPEGKTEWTHSVTLREERGSTRHRASSRAPKEAVDSPASTPQIPQRIENAESGSSASAGNGTLQVNSMPWSEVYIDGRHIGSTPQTNISLPPGTYRVELINPQFNARESFTVEIKAGQTVRKIVKLQIP
ncbi:MAG: serine/threonine-protein kinase [Sandaracinaceae bacterium]|nr:serine/threonine-protein kinase [Sandaracinaceae bacterium]